MAFLKLPFVRRMVILAVCDVLLFKLVGLPHEAGTKFEPEHGNDVDIGETVLEQVLEGTWNVEFCGSLTKCPDTTKSIYIRKICFPPAPPEKKYHCGFDPDAKRSVDFYRRPFMCPAGTYGAPKIHIGDLVEMVCKRCPEGRFNPIDRYSPDSMDECRSHYHKPVTDDMHVILYLPGNNTDPAVYYCDYLNRWVSVDKSMFCRHSYYPCRCIYVGDMCFAEDLLPDWSCDAKCTEPRQPRFNFSCIQETISPSTEDTLDRKTSHPSAWPWFIYTTNTPQNNESSSLHPAISDLQNNTDNKQEDPRAYDGHKKTYLGMIFSVTIPIIIVSLVVCFVVYKCGGNNTNNEITYGDRIICKGKKVYMNMGNDHSDNSSNSVAESKKGAITVRTGPQEGAKHKDDEAKSMLLTQEDATHKDDETKLKLLEQGEPSVTDDHLRMKELKQEDATN